MPDDGRSTLTSAIPVRAGPVRALLDGVDLRELHVGETRLLDRVHVAVRAADWSTVPGDISDLEVRSEDSTFEVSFSSRHRAGALDLEWRGVISGDADGHITCRMDGEALTRFEYCRIGFCVLHPDSLAGAAYEARTLAGDAAGHLPRLIAPQVLKDGGVVPPIPAFEALTVRSADGRSVRVESDGQPFEMEDQRNWTDASFKSYVPPIRPGYPYVAEQGARFRQCVTISVDPVAAQEPLVQSGDSVEVELGRGSGRWLPAVGLGIASDGLGLDEREVGLIRRLAPDHLRLEVRPSRPGWRDEVEEGARQASRVACDLEIAAFVSAADADAMAWLAGRLAPERVARWAAFDTVVAYTASTSPEVVKMVRAALDAASPGAVLAAGTAGDFVRLNRGPPLFDGVDALTWAIDPTFHAGDDRSILQNALAQGITVETARAFAEGRELCVGPVELSRRSAPADPRQASPIAAAWTVASLGDICVAGPHSVTYFETAGPGGLLARTTGQQDVRRPVYRVFEHLARMRGGELLDLRPSVRRDIGGIIVRRGGELTGMLANLTPEVQRLSLGPLERPHSMRFTEVAADVTELAGDLGRPADDRVRLTLAPYAVALLDSTPSAI